MFDFSTVHAVIIGINEYGTLGTLKTAVSDARAMSDYLKNELHVKEENIKLLEDGAAKKNDILDAIDSVAKIAKRYDPIVFFFSGFAGQVPTEGDEKEALLCTVDVNTSGGITDGSLLQKFDQISKKNGNNITVLLDCPAEIFSWVNPASFVVVAPNTAKDGEDGGAFTKAMLNVLRRKPLNERTKEEALTVEAFAGHVQAEMDDVEVRALGANVNRPLFDVRGDGSHHVFIPGRALSDGRIALDIGLAQGVRVGAIYGIYPGNVKGVKKLGTLKVYALDDNGRMATFCDKDDLKVPNFFYAVEEECYHEDIKVFATGSSGTLDEYSGWTASTEADAVISANVADGQVSITWNGFLDDPKLAPNRPDDELDVDEPYSIQRAIRRAARFHHLVGAPTPEKSAISSCLKIKFGRVGVSDDNIFDNDRFDGLKTLKLEVKRGEPLGPYSLTIVNNNPHPVWPYIFLCDPEDFTILNWYIPPAGLLKAPLQAGKTLVIGSGSDQKSFMFSYMWSRVRDYTYIKIFVTTEKMNFTPFQQWGTSPTEDNFRGYIKQKVDISPSESRILQVQSPKKERESGSKIPVSPWASTRITIFKTYKDDAADSS